MILKKQLLCIHKTFFSSNCTFKLKQANKWLFSLWKLSNFRGWNRLGQKVFFSFWNPLSCGINIVKYYSYSFVGENKARIETVSLMLWIGTKRYWFVNSHRSRYGVYPWQLTNQASKQWKTLAITGDWS